MINLLSREKLSFLIVGVLSASTHFAIFYLLFKVLIWSIVLSTLLAYLGSLAVSYSLNYIHTFKSEQDIIKSGTKYFITTLLGLAWNIGLMVLFIDHLHIHYFISFLMMSFVVMINNYLLSKHWVF